MAGDPAGPGPAAPGPLAAAAAAPARTLTVGAGQQYATIAAAIAAAQNGDTVQVQAGTYTNDFASISKNITLHGVGGMVNLVATGNISNGKGIFVVNGVVNIDHFSFSGATVADGNGAGIRFESGNLVLENDYFFNNQNGLLAGSSGAITIRNSEFASNGTGDGFTHNLYVNQLSSLVIDASYFHDAVVGHEIKSRALATTIQNSRIQDQNGTASYSIDLPNGGNALIYNNTIEQGPNSDNPVIIAFGEEGGVYSGSALQVTNNLVLNHLGSSSARAINNTVSNVTAQITGNRFFGLTQSQVANGANTQSGNQLLTSEPALVTTHPWLDSSVTTNATVAVSDTTTGQAIAATPSPYSGPVAGLVQQYIYGGSDNVNITVTGDNWFLHGGPGDDAMAAIGGINVLDGGTG